MFVVFSLVLATSHSPAMQPVPVEAGPAAVASGPNWKAMGFDELVARLPEADGEMEFDPAKKEWVELPASAEMRRRLLDGALSDAQIAAALKSARVLACPGRWPAKMPLEVSLRAPLWLGMSGQLKAMPRLKNAEPAEQFVLYGGCGLANDYERGHRDNIDVGFVPGSVREVVFDISLTANRFALGEHGNRTWKGTLAFPITPVASAAEALEPTRSEAFDRAVRGAMTFNIAKNGGNPARTAVWLQLTRTPDLEPFLKDAACRAVVEILDGDEVRDRFEVDFRHRCMPPSMASYYRDALTASDLEDRSFVNRLRVRVRGDANASLHDVRRTHYWDGTIEARFVDLMSGR